MRCFSFLSSHVYDSSYAKFHLSIQNGNLCINLYDLLRYMHCCRSCRVGFYRVIFAVQRLFSTTPYLYLTKLVSNFVHIVSYLILFVYVYSRYVMIVYLLNKNQFFFCLRISDYKMSFQFFTYFISTTFSDNKACLL